MKNIFYKILPVLFVLIGCDQQEKETLDMLAADSPHIAGKSEYLDSPFVTAGNRVYLVGHQNGSFPELGWHIKGEMGGIWDHPIKLMDGFEVALHLTGETLSLNHAESFVNYPFFNKHLYNFEGNNLRVERWQFVPDNKEGIVVQFVLKNTSKASQNVAFQFTGHTDLRPTWLGEETNMIDAKDEASYKQDSDVWLVKDSGNPWFAAFGADKKSSQRDTEEKSFSGKGVTNSLTFDIVLPADGSQTINFVIAGSYVSEQATMSTYKNLHNHILTDFKKKKTRYESLAYQTKLTIPDKKLQETFEWLKYNCDWLVRTVPEIGTGITAGIPDYPWWFGVDSEYALKGYMAIGQTKPVYETIHLLDSMSNVINGNGRIIHEMSTNGKVFNKGNINETPQFASLIWEVYQWDGDLQFLKKYFPTIQKGLRWLMVENDANKNLFPDGFGMMEIHGLDSEMIDVASYTQRAFDDASKMAMELGNNSLAQTYRKTADTLKKKINTEFWSEEFNSFADFIGTDQLAIKLIEDAIVRADTLNKPWAVTELQNTKTSILKNPSKKARPFVLHHNWVVNTPMEMQIADPDKAQKALKTAEKFVNPFGVFVTGIDRDASAGSEEGSFKGSKAFSYTGAVMTLPTGVQAVSENNYGNPDKALDYLKRMSRSFSYALPGSMYEVSPDYGMMAQAWNIYGFAIPIVKQFFGVRPMASKKLVTIKPQMPSEWATASLENIRISDNLISIYYHKSKSRTTLKIEQQNPDWTISLVLPTKMGGKIYKIVKSDVQPQEKENNLIFSSKKSVSEIILDYN